MSRETAAELTTIMEAVVERGTATAAQIPGYTVAGKTGTATKVVNRVYVPGLYNSSFVGFVPSRDPAVTIVVVIDTPRNGAYYGGAVAAPLFKRIAEATLQHLGIGPTINPVPPVLVSNDDATGVAVRPAVADAPPALFFTPPLGPDGQPVVPDLTGLGAREAVQTLTRMGIAVTVQGAGVVVSQEPPPGTPIAADARCRLSLTRASTRPPAGGGGRP
jgi:membrane peptidoglycan carboxypeptidase